MFVLSSWNNEVHLDLRKTPGRIEPAASRGLYQAAGRKKFIQNKAFESRSSMSSTLCFLDLRNTIQADLQGLDREGFCMHVISRRRLREFWEVHADAEEPLTRWYKLAKAAAWASFAELRADCPSADQVEHLTVIDIGGNKYRLIAEVFFRDQVVLVRHVLTH
jgi:mRNA interferase HigB